MDNITLTQSILLSIGCSLIASFIFLFCVLMLFRPRIKICPFICMNNDNIIGDNNNYYYFKIVNTSLFSAYDMKVQLSVLKKYPTPPSGMMNKRTIPLSLVLDTVSHLPSYKPLWIRRDANHCIRFRTVDDLTILINDEFNSIQLQVTLRHGLTGLVKVFYQDFADISLIKQGKFTYGTKFGVI